MRGGNLHGDDVQSPQRIHSKRSLVRDFAIDGEETYCFLNAGPMRSPHVQPVAASDLSRSGLSLFALIDCAVR